MSEQLEKLELVSPVRLKCNNTIYDALKILDEKNWMIIVIEDDHNNIQGIVSPGDLRKAILNGKPVVAQLETVMNRDPICIQAGQLKGAINVNEIRDDLAKRYGDVTMFYAMIPVVNSEKKVLGVVSLESLSSYATSPKVKAHNKTVLIVGGAGFIGSVLTRVLLEQGWSVRVLDKLLYSEDSLKGLDGERFELVKGDAVNIDNLVNAVEGVDAVIYLAELVGDPACSHAPQTALKTNYLAVTSLAHLCSHLNINRFIYTSSCSVYGASKNPDELLTEESPLGPVSLYARIKALVESSILLVCNLPNPLFAPTILRLSTVFGHSYRPRFDLVVNTFVKNALQKGAIKVFGGEQWRPNVHVRDVCSAITQVLSSPIERVRAQIFNVGSNNENYTISGLSEIAKEVFPHIEIQKERGMVDARNYRVDFSKIEQVLNFKAQYSVKQGMLELKEAFGKKRLDELDSIEYSNYKRLQKLDLV